MPLKIKPLRKDRPKEPVKSLAPAGEFKVKKTFEKSGKFIQHRLNGRMVTSTREYRKKLFEVSLCCSCIKRKKCDIYSRLSNLYARENVIVPVGSCPHFVEGDPVACGAS